MLKLGNVDFVYSVGLSMWKNTAHRGNLPQATSVIIDIAKPLHVAYRRKIFTSLKYNMCSIIWDNIYWDQASTG